MSDHIKKKTINKSKIKEDVAEFFQQVIKNKPDLPPSQYFAEFRNYADEKHIDVENKEVITEYNEQITKMLEKDDPDWQKNEAITRLRKSITIK